MTLKYASTAMMKAKVIMADIRHHEQLALIYVVSNYAADESKEQDRKRRGKADHAEPESRVGKLQHQPALGDVLHPGADVREEVAGPEEPEVAMARARARRGICMAVVQPRQ